MRRPLEEVIASQEQMLKQLGTAGAPVQGAAMMAAFETHLRHVCAWLESQRNIKVCPVEHGLLLEAPEQEARRIQKFLDLPLDIAAMAAQVDVSLHRQRSAHTSAAAQRAGATAGS